MSKYNNSRLTYELTFYEELFLWPSQITQQSLLYMRSEVSVNFRLELSTYIMKTVFRKYFSTFYHNMKATYSL